MDCKRIAFRCEPFKTFAITRGMGGLFFSYGTLQIDAGRAVERLTFVLNIDAVANALRPHAMVS